MNHRQLAAAPTPLGSIILWGGHNYQVIPPAEDANGDLAAIWRELEAFVDATNGIDQWCSGPDWVLPANAAFAPESKPLTIREGGLGLALLARYELSDGECTIAGLEPLWGFASPILTGDPAGFAEILAAALEVEPGWQRLVLPGVPNQDAARQLAGPLSRLGPISASEGISSQVADLGDGVDAWFARRTSRFRTSIRRASKQAEAEGITFHNVSQDPDIFNRCVRIETESWKGVEEDGLLSPPMHRFYDLMIARLRERGRLRAMVARRNDRDIGYIFGGVRNSRYRGLQLSFVEAARQLSISHLLQFQTITALAAEPEPVFWYDLGMDMEYKRRWADRSTGSIVVVVDRVRGGATRRVG